MKHAGSTELQVGNTFRYTPTGCEMICFEEASKVTRDMWDEAEKFTTLTGIDRARPGGDRTVKVTRRGSQIVRIEEVLP